MFWCLDKLITGRLSKSGLKDLSKANWFRYTILINLMLSLEKFSAYANQPSPENILKLKVINVLHRNWILLVEQS